MYVLRWCGRMVGMMGNSLCWEDVVVWLGWWATPSVQMRWSHGWNDRKLPLLRWCGSMVKMMGNSLCWDDVVPWLGWWATPSVEMMWLHGWDDGQLPLLRWCGSMVEMMDNSLCWDDVVPWLGWWATPSVPLTTLLQLRLVRRRMLQTVRNDTLALLCGLFADGAGWHSSREFILSDMSWHYIKLWWANGLVIFYREFLELFSTAWLKQILIFQVIMFMSRISPSICFTPCISLCWELNLIVSFWCFVKYVVMT